jgi:hypothetical protein
MIETYYVMEDGSVAHPREVSPDKNGVLRNKKGAAVAMRRPGSPRTRSVDSAERPAPKAAPAPVQSEPVADQPEFPAVAEEPKAEDTKALEPESPRRGYHTRESKAD